VTALHEGGRTECTGLKRRMAILSHSRARALLRVAKLRGVVRAETAAVSQ
jgi:hypothetical protein